MKPRHKRLTIVAVVVLVLGAAVALILNAFQSNLVFFFSPSQISRHEAPEGRTFRLGGLVVAGSVKRWRGSEFPGNGHGTGRAGAL